CGARERSGFRHRRMASLSLPLRRGAAEPSLRAALRRADGRGRVERLVRGEGRRRAGACPPRQRWSERAPARFRRPQGRAPHVRRQRQTRTAAVPRGGRSRRGDRDERSASGAAGLRVKLGRAHLALCVVAVAAVGTFIAARTTARDPLTVADGALLAVVTNERDGTVSVIDVANDRVLSALEAGLGPRGIQAGAEAGVVYVA